MNSKGISQRYQKYGIRTRILALFALLVVLPYMILIITVFTVFQQYASKSYGENMVETLTAVSEQVSSNIKKYEDNTMSLYYNGCVEQLGIEPTIETAEFIQASLDATCYAYSDIMSAYITTGDRSYVSGFMPFENIFQVMEPHRQEIIDEGGSCVWYTSEELFGRANANHFILARSLNSKTDSNVGILYLVVGNKMVASIFDKLRMEDSVKYLTDSNGRILYSTEATAQGTYPLDKLSDPNKNGYNIYDNEVIASLHLWDTDWYFISTISVPDMMKSVSQLRVLIVIVSVVYLVFLIIMTIMLQKYVFNPIGVLKKAMDSFAQGDLDIRMEDVGVGELKSVSRHFNNMTTKIQDLVVTNEQEVTSKNNFRMQALVAQLTPHFVYNALNTIKWTAVVNKQENIQNLTQSLIHILMNAAKVEGINFLISEEIDLIENYAVIQKARFLNFDLLIDVTEEAKDCKIRKFLIQPVIENAIVHGLKRGTVRKGIVEVKIWLENETLRIEVKDNGVGFSVDEWRGRDEAVANHTNIGLKNIEEIIQLDYGTEYGLTIVSETGNGTTVSYTLPIIRG